MKFNLTLIASEDDGECHMIGAAVTIPLDAMEGMKPTKKAALDVILLRLREAGFSVD